MAKKVVINKAPSPSSSSLKASIQAPTKKHHHHHHHLNSLIKVLKPKVYITDTACFKKLVQELTGNGTTTAKYHLHDQHPPPPSSEKVAPVFTVEDDVFDHHHDQQTTSFVEAVSAAIDDSSSSDRQSYFSNLTPSSSSSDISNQLAVPEPCFDFDELISSSSRYSKSLSFSYQDLESWLDMEPELPLYDGLGQFLEPMVSIYDYDLSGI